MRRIPYELIVLCNIFGTSFGRMPTAYDCDVLRQHGVLTPHCKARYIVHEGKAPLVIDNDEDVSFVEQRRSPPPLHSQKTQLVDSNECPVDDNDGNFILNFFAVFRQFIMCDALKLKQLPKMIDFDTDEKPQIRRAPVRKLPKSTHPSVKTLNNKPPKTKLPSRQPAQTLQIQKTNQRQQPQKSNLKKPKKGQLNERYKNIETIRWHDPLNKYHASEFHKRFNRKLKIQPTTLNRSTFHSQSI